MSNALATFKGCHAHHALHYYPLYTVKLNLCIAFLHSSVHACRMPHALQMALERDVVHKRNKTKQTSKQTNKQSKIKQTHTKTTKTNKQASKRANKQERQQTSSPTHFSPRSGSWQLMSQ
jgi:hypothetical protein